jgi:hypothetical protein
MKRCFAKIAPVAILALALFGVYRLGARQRPTACEVRRSSLDSQTIEVWRDGELADEWQPEDGAIYTMLDYVLRDEMPPEAQQRARERLKERPPQPLPSTPESFVEARRNKLRMTDKRAPRNSCCARFAHAS